MNRIKVRRVRSEEDAKKLIGMICERRESNVTEPAHFEDADTGRCLFIYDKAPESFLRLREAITRVKFTTTYRGQTGIRNISRIFGYMPRKPMMQREGCRDASLTADCPELAMALSIEALRLFNRLEEMCPDQAREAMEAVQEVKPGWRLHAKGPWTSGVINLSSSMPYHRDMFNFDCWSAMPILRKDCTGGQLILPEYDLSVACDDGMCVWFSGYGLVHGVAPLTLESKAGYRLTTVFYALRGIKDCADYAMEVHRAKVERAKREETMAKKLREKRDAETAAKAAGAALGAGSGPAAAPRAPLAAPEAPPGPAAPAAPAAPAEAPLAALNVLRARAAAARAAAEAARAEAAARAAELAVLEAEAAQ